MIKKFLSPLLLTVFLLGLSQFSYGYDPGENWWDSAVFYQIFPLSFYDSDGDGDGDLQGIIEKLDYLEDLGITALWLTPVHPSGKGAYHGYAVSDYYAINERLGTMEDYEQLIEELHQRDMKIIMDFVINHTGTEIDWFVDAYSDLNSPYRDWYLWEDSELTGWANASGNTSQPAWNFLDMEDVPRGDQYFYAAFNNSIPDLNVENEEVVDELINIAEFWMEKGVDGFRLDAVRYMIETGAGEQLDTAETIDWLTDFANRIKDYNSDAYVIGEVYAGLEIAKTYYAEGEGLDALFNFKIAGRGNVIQGSFSTGKTDAFYREMGKYVDIDEEGVPFEYFSHFFSNHDSGRMPENLQTGDKVKAAALVMYTIPGGAPYIYYGDEIGMREGFEMIGDAEKRNPMWWDGTKNAGFTTDTAAWTIKMKEEYYTNINVAAQEDDPQSPLSFFKILNRMRTGMPVLQEGEIEFIEIDPDFTTYLDDPEKTIKKSPLLAYNRTLDNQAVMVIVNPGRHELEVKQDVVCDFIDANKGFISVTDSIWSEDLTATVPEDIIADITRGTFDLTLQSRGFLVLEMEIK